MLAAGTDQIRYSASSSCEEAPFPNIRHMFLGHIHRPIAGSWNGIPFSVFRGTAHQVALRMVETPHLVRSHEPPAYGVILLNPQTTVVHFHDFLDDTAFVAEADVARRRKLESETQNGLN